MPPAQSSGGLLALLQEPEDKLKAFALQKLNDCIDSQWHTVSSSISAIEALHEDEGFTHRELAALVASKVCFTLVTTAEIFRG